ncbi:histidine kinase OS=Streptomyces fumanus OX=67302 GN=GCM10018772_39760 PE=4 SV=1 [Streptomyces fumanus]
MIRRLWRSWRRLRLGTRLALGLGVLSLAVFAVVGTALTASMREYLQARLVDQMKLVQVVQSKDAATHGTVERQPYYGWYTGHVRRHRRLRRPAPARRRTGGQRGADRPGRDPGPAGQDLTRSVRIDGRGPYLLRACEVRPGVVLVSAAPLGDVENTMDRLIAVQVVAYGLALLALVVLGRRMLRRGLRPLSKMARTAHGIASHDLTRSAAQLPLRAAGRPGGREVEELRTAFNAMLEHIDDSLAVRAEAERRLRRFVADASHELRTPLMSVRGYADLFQYAAANERGERERHLARLRAEAARMGVLLDDLLLLARLDAAEVEAPLRRTDTDLTELVRQAADAFRASHPGRPLTVTAGPEALTLPLDPQRIRQVLDNLLTNAAVHTPPGTSVSVTVTAGADTAEVRVADTGPGVPAADRDRVFDRFYRVDKARSRDRGGSARLGLAVARSLVEAHGGTVTSDRRAGRDGVHGDAAAARGPVRVSSRRASAAARGS